MEVLAAGLCQRVRVAIRLEILAAIWIFGTSLAPKLSVCRECSRFHPKIVSVIKEVSMALWNQATPEVSPEKPQPVPPVPTSTPTATTAAPTPAPTPVMPTPKESPASGRRESIFGPGVTIEGKIEGDADIRIGGKFKGDIQIKGDLNLDKGAKVSAKVQAANVTIGGELEGNVIAGAQVKLLESGQLVGDLKAATLTVVAGSRMRGHVEFGWSASEVAKFSNGHAQEKEKVGAAG
jgi:cytoskeletal protein CcmA (bactofilin family)